MRFFPLKSPKILFTVVFALFSLALEFFFSRSRLSTLAKASLSLVLRAVRETGKA